MHKYNQASTRQDYIQMLKYFIGLYAEHLKKRNIPAAERAKCLKESLSVISKKTANLRYGAKQGAKRNLGL